MENRRLNKIQKVLILVGLLFIPSLMFYFFLLTGVHRVSRLPFYGPKTEIEKTERGKQVIDTLYYEIEPFILNTAFHGKDFSSETFNGYIWIAHVIPLQALNTEKLTFPPQIVYAAKEVLNAQADIRFLSVITGINELIDLPKPGSYTPVLKAVEEQWTYGLVGDEEWNYHSSFFPETENVKDPQSLVLLDKEGRIRGYYNPLKAGDIKNLVEDLTHLKLEYSLDYKTHRFFDYNKKLEQKRQ
jgi:hypothetical protein